MGMDNLVPDMPYKALYEEGTRILMSSDPDALREASLDARLLLEYVCQSNINTLLMEPDRPVSAGETMRYKDLLMRRKEREPLAYIVGSTDFMGLTFEVNRDVLIPEQDTENLVEEIMKEICSGDRILDLCTGSGCILLSLLHYSRGTSGIGTDLSPKALRTAQRNAQRLDLAGRAEWMQGDLFDALGLQPQFDVIVSNPPYIRTDVIRELAPEVKDHEPLMALDGGEDGLLFYRKIIPGAVSRLVTGGILYLEIGYDQGKAVSDLMKEAGYYDVRVIKDYGGNDRIVRGIRSIHQ